MIIVLKGCYNMPCTKIRQFYRAGIFGFQIVVCCCLIDYVKKINMTNNHFIASKLENGKGSHTLMFHEGFQLTD